MAAGIAGYPGGAALRRDWVMEEEHAGPSPRLCGPSMTDDCA